MGEAGHHLGRNRTRMTNAESPSSTWRKKMIEVDRVVRGWMETQGWPVPEETPPDFERKIYPWRHDVVGECYTLWITKKVIEDYEPSEIEEALNRLKVAEMFRQQPEADIRLRCSPTSIVVEQLPGPPK